MKPMLLIKPTNEVSIFITSVLLFGNKIKDVKKSNRGYTNSIYKYKEALYQLEIIWDLMGGKRRVWKCNYRKI